MSGSRRLALVPIPLLAVLLAVSLSGCGASTPKQDPAGVNGQWNAVSIRNGAGTSPVLPTGSAPTALFAEGALTGNGGVNSYHAQYTVSGADAIAITLGAVTKMAGPPASMAQENAYLSALADARHYRVTPDSLDLLDDKGATLVSYARAVPVTLENNLWTCTGYNNGKQAVVSLVQSSTITVRFGADGRLSGSGGVNQYATSYTATGASMTIDGIMVTTRMSGPPELMAQEKAYLHALQQAARFEISGDTLDIWGGDTMSRLATYRLAKP